jgi:hypothetical protein
MEEELREELSRVSFGPFTAGLGAIEPGSPRWRKNRTENSTCERYHHPFSKARAYNEYRWPIYIVLRSSGRCSGYCTPNRDSLLV